MRYRHSRFFGRKRDEMGRRGRGKKSEKEEARKKGGRRRESHRL